MGAIAKQTICAARKCMDWIAFSCAGVCARVSVVAATDLLRVSANILGLSMMLLGGLCWLTGKATSPPEDSKLIAGLVGATSSRCHAPLWTTHRPRFCWPLESYINGVHIFKEPQPWLFRCFPGRRSLSRDSRSFFCLLRICAAAGLDCSAGWTGIVHASFHGIRFVAHPALRCLRLLHSGPISSDALRHPARDLFFVYACALGFWAEGIQPAHPAGEDFAAVYWCTSNLFTEDFPSCPKASAVN